MTQLAVVVVGGVGMWAARSSYPIASRSRPSTYPCPIVHGKGGNIITLTK